MRTYQTLSLIGCILGMLLTIGLLLTMSFLSGTENVLMNMSKNLSPNNPQNAINQQNFENTKARNQPFITGLAFAFFMYIGAIVITFVVKNTKAVGITLLGIGVIAMVITNYWGIIPFGLLLPAGIVALRLKAERNITL
jgi:hypothetical protein